MHCTGAFSKERLSEGHLSVRFGDVAPDAITVLLDGRDVTVNCFEAMAGPDGWVYLYSPDGGLAKGVCPFAPDHGYLVRRSGRVEVTVRRFA